MGMKVIGITGGVGAGKSRVLAFLREDCGARVIQADQVGHEVMEPGTACFHRITEIFGSEILASDGRIDRKILGEIVFSHAQKRKLLNGIVHPAVKERIRHELAQARQAECALFVIEAALLIEDHYEELCEEFWYIYADEAVRRERLKASRGYSDEKITAIFASQQPDWVFRAHCQAVVDNSGSMEETKCQLRKLLLMTAPEAAWDKQGKGEQKR